MVIRGVGLCAGPGTVGGGGGVNADPTGHTASVFSEPHTQSPSAVHGHPTSWRSAVRSLRLWPPGRVLVLPRLVLPTSTHKVGGGGR